MIKLHVRKTYGERKVLDIDELELEKGKKYAFIGSNGSGKSTLLKIIAGVEKGDKGSEVTFDHIVDIGYMPQNNYAFSLSVKRNLMLGVKGKDRKQSKECCQRLLEQMDLKKLERKNGKKLSGGETQKVALCRVLMLPHDVLILDEPTSAIDIQSVNKAEVALQEYIKDNETTLIFATHSIKQAERFADEIIFLKDGEVIERVNSANLKGAQSSELIEFMKHN